jgi:hypothetical protein
LPLTVETQAVLARIRTYGWVLNVFGQSQSRAWRLVKARVERRVSLSGVALPYVNVYRRYVHELVKAFRTETGEPLAKVIELAIRRWANLGLASALLQELLGDCFLRFEQQGYAMPGVKPLTHGKPRAPKSHLLRRCYYEDALKQGRVSRHQAATIEDQSASHTKGIAQNREISRKLAVLLAARKIPGRQFILYNAFAQKLGRLSRKYSAESLQMAAADIIDLYEAKSLDGDTLRAIASTVFGVNVSSCWSFPKIWASSGLTN